MNYETMVKDYAFEVHGHEEDVVTATCVVEDRGEDQALMTCLKLLRPSTIGL